MFLLENHCFFLFSHIIEHGAVLVNRA